MKIKIYIIIYVWSTLWIPQSLTNDLYLTSQTLSDTESLFNHLPRLCQTLSLCLRRCNAIINHRVLIHGLLRSLSYHIMNLL